MQTYREKRHQEMKTNLARDQQEPEYQQIEKAASITLAISDAAMDTARIIIVDSIKQAVIRSLIDELDGASSEFWHIPMRNYWIEPEIPLEFDGLNMFVKSIFFCSGDEATIALAKSKSPAASHPMIEQMAAFQKMCMVDVADEFGDIIFSFHYNPDRKKWGYTDAFHICPWGQCVPPGKIGTKAPCNECELIRGYLTSYLCAAIHTDRAERNEISEDTAPAENRAENTQDIDPVLINLVKAANQSASMLERSLVPAFIKNYAQLERETLDYLRNKRAANFEVQATKLLFLFQKEGIKNSRIIIISEEAQDLIEQEIQARGGVLSEELQALIPPAQPDTWIKLARPLTMPGTTWDAGILYINKPNDTRIMKYVMPDLSPDLRPIAERLREVSEQKTPQFCTDIIDPNHLRVKFSLEYRAGEKWLGSEEQHTCAYNRRDCTWKKMCLECQYIFKYLHAYIAMILKAHAGEFATEIHEDTERVKVERKQHKSSSNKKKRTPPSWQDRRIYTLNVDISKRIIPTTSAAGNTQEEQEQHEPRPNWLKIHNPNDIETEEKVQGAYQRYGQWIIPKKKRPYRKLKPGVAPIHIQHMKA